MSTSFVTFVANTPINAATTVVIANNTNTVTKILPSLLGCLILLIAVVILKNTSGTIVTNNKFKKISPSGLKTAAFSPNAIPTIAPIIIAAISIITDL